MKKSKNIIQFKRMLKKIIKPEINNRVHFLHIGKTGGSIIKYCIDNCKSGSSTIDIIAHNHNFSLENVPVGEKVVFFLRDPVVRFVSGFYSRMREGRPRYHYPWSDCERISFEKFKTANQLAESLSVENPDFNSANDSMNCIQHVCDKYDKWLLDVKYIEARLPDILHIGFQETLSMDFDILKYKLSLDDSCELPVDPTISHKTPDSFDKHLSDESILNLKNHYQNDYEIYDFCKNIAKHINSK